MTNQINDGGPAFPMGYYSEPFGSMGPKMTVNGGMSLRDYFAATALPAAWNAFDSGYFGDTGHESEIVAVATAAYRMADAMIKAREVKP